MVDTDRPNCLPCHQLRWLNNGLEQGFVWLLDNIHIDCHVFVARCVNPHVFIPAINSGSALEIK